MQIIKGNKALAASLGVSVRTIQQWRSEGLLRNATICDYRRTIIYNLDAVLYAMESWRPGRRLRRR